METSIFDQEGEQRQTPPLKKIAIANEGRAGHWKQPLLPFTSNDITNFFVAALDSQLQETKQNKGNKNERIL